MIRLLLLITSIQGGGAERTAAELSRHLKPEIQRKVVTLMDGDAYSLNDPRVSMHLTFREPKYVSMVFWGTYAIFRSRQIKKEFNADISLSFLVLDNLINILSNIGLSSTKTVISVHSVPSKKVDHRIFGIIFRIFIRTLYNRADRIIAISESIRAELVDYLNINPEKIVITPNPVDIDAIAVLSQEPIEERYTNDKIPLVVTVGSLRRPKGQWHLIRAFSLVKKETACKLLICGQGELEPYLRGLVKGYGLEDDVIFLGWQKNPFKYLSKASMFVFPSLWEALPYAMIEAMACNCPIIATDCKYGPRQILGENEYGILVPELDGAYYNHSDPLTEAEIYLANEIVRLLKDEDLRSSYAKKARERVTIFETKRILTNYEEIFEQLVNSFQP